MHLNFLIIAIFLTICTTFALDWDKWRGPDENSISKETGWNPKALEKGAKITWTRELGQGYSAVSVKGEKLFTMGNLNKMDIVYCLNSKSGDVIWTYKYACEDGGYPGPRATPVLDGGNLYTMSREGHLICLNAETGKELWVKKVINEFKAENLTWGLASSVKVHNNMLLVNAGESGLAVDKKTGSLIWGKPGAGNYATPVTAKIGSNILAAIIGKEHIYLVNPAQGEVKASFPWESRYSIIAADPVIMGNNIYMSSGYGRGGTLLSYKGGKLNQLWENKNLRAHFSTPIYVDGYIYGIDGNAGNAGKKKASLKCMEVKTGDIKWEENTGFGNLMAADGKLIVLNEDGKLFIAKISSDKYTEYSSAQVLDKKVCWTMPVLSSASFIAATAREPWPPLMCLSKKIQRQI